MAENSQIEWCDCTFNPWIGCSKVHEGCTNCYAERDFAKRRKRVEWGPAGTRKRTTDAYWRQPLKWNRDAEKAGVRARVFCASLADVFEDWQGPMHVANGDNWWIGDGVQRIGGMDDCRRDLFALIDATPWLDWLLLTKRPQNVRRMWMLPHNGREPGDPLVLRRENVWLGTSISKQEHADSQIPELLKCRDLAPVLFLSAEPLLGPIDLTRLNNGGGETYDALRAKCTTHEGYRFRTSDTAPIDWVIVGGESGPNARPMHPAWARSLRDQCEAAGVPFFFKQWGEWAEYQVVPGGDLGGLMRRGKVTQVELDRPMDGHFRRGDVYMRRVGKTAAGRLLDGREWSECPSMEAAHA